jgi:autophagy-related protein 5
VSTAPLPFKLTLHFIPEEETPHLTDITPLVLHDSFINSVKEADFLRSGTAKPIMTLSASESKALWTSVQENDLRTFAKIHNTLLPTPGQLRNIPLRVYLPSTPGDDTSKPQIKVIQSQISPTVSSIQSSPVPSRGPTSQPQTLGSALHTLIPNLFPSRRTPILATPLLHGAPIPMTATLEDLVRWACYADGWLSVVIAVRG